MDTPNERADRLQERLLMAFRVAMSERGVKSYAADLEIGHTTLLHKLEPENPSDSLTLRQLCLLLVRVDAGAVMRPVAAELGGQWLTIPSAERIGADLHRLMSEASREFGQVSDVLLAGTDPNGPGGVNWTDDELDRLEREADEANAKLHLIVAAARQHKAKPPLAIVRT